MKKTDIPSFVENLIEAGNAYDTEKYLSFYQENAVLDDPSVGRKFSRHKGIRDYFETYFIGYKTQSTLKKLEYSAEDAHLEIQFTGNFPGGVVTGTFDFRFINGKIAAAKAYLI